MLVIALMKGCGVPHLRMPRLNLSQAGSLDVMLILASATTAVVPRESKPTLGYFADACGNTAATEWKQRRSASERGTPAS